MQATLLPSGEHLECGFGSSNGVFFDTRRSDANLSPGFLGGRSATCATETSLEQRVAVTVDFPLAATISGTWSVAEGAERNPADFSIAPPGVSWVLGPGSGTQQHVLDVADNTTKPGGELSIDEIQDTSGLWCTNTGCGSAPERSMSGSARAWDSDTGLEVQVSFEKIPWFGE